MGTEPIAENQSFRVDQRLFTESHIATLSLNALRLFLLVCQRTYKWRNADVSASDATICDITGMQKMDVANARRELTRVGLLTVAHDGRFCRFRLTGNFPTNIKS
jgi:hypothetical protein